MKVTAAEILTDTSLLLYGHDVTLLETRALIMARAGFDVQLARTPQQAALLLSTQPVPLVVICHSVPGEEGKSVAALAAARCPAVQCLFLITVFTSATPLLSETCQTGDGPEALVTSVRRLLKSFRLSAATAEKLT